MAKKATPRTRRSPARSTAPRDKLSDAAMPITSPRVDLDPPPAQAEPVFGGPTTAYRDGDGIVETADCPDGQIPDGWFDTPAGLKNNYREGMVKVKLDELA